MAFWDPPSGPKNLMVIERYILNGPTRMHFQRSPTVMHNLVKKDSYPKVNFSCRLWNREVDIIPHFKLEPILL